VNAESPGTVELEIDRISAYQVDVIYAGLDGRRTPMTEVQVGQISVQ